jgi:hypothetical protein
VPAERAYADRSVGRGFAGAVFLAHVWKAKSIDKKQVGED